MTASILRFNLIPAGVQLRRRVPINNLRLLKKDAREVGEHCTTRFKKADAVSTSSGVMGKKLPTRADEVVRAGKEEEEEEEEAEVDAAAAAAEEEEEEEAKVPDGPLEAAVAP